MNKKISCLLIFTLVANIFLGLPAINIPAYAADLEDSKVLDLKFEDNIEDSSTNNINGILNGTATYIEGQKEKAISLNGTDNYIDLGTSAALQPENLTVSVWVYASTVLTGEHMITWFKPSGNYRGNGWYLSCLDDNTPLKLSTGTAPQEAYVSGSRSAFFPAGKWTHIAVTYESTTGNVAIYRNGVAQSVSYTTKVANGITANSTDHKYIGFNSPGYDFGHARLGLDEFKIYSTVATQDQIQAIYTSEGGTISVTGVSLDKNTASVDIGQNIQLTAAVAPAGAGNKAVTWSSSDDAIATVDNTGKVTGVRRGIATITVTTADGNFNASCLVTVGNVAVTGVTLDKSTISTGVGHITQLTATVAPQGATNSAVTWSSSDATVATVDNTGRVAGIKEGTATITVTTTDGNFTASCTVTVTKESYDPYAKVQQFDMGEVNITDPYYINAFNKDVDYLMSLEPDRLLSGFRTTAGLTAKASVYGGWENTLIKGHTMGHYITALAQAYKQTKGDTDTTLNTQIKTRLDYIISELKASQDANINTTNGAGFLFASDKTQFDILEGKASGSTWVPWYTMHKILAGLIDVYKNEGNDDALGVASNLGDWIYNRVSAWDSSMQARVLGVEYGGMNDCLYELYKVTKNPNHLAAAHKFDQDSLFNTIGAGNNTLPGSHANTAIPKFVGALNRYRTLGDSESFYLNAAESFWDMVVNHHSYITGGNSQDEHFRTPDVLDAYRDNVNNETCNTFNMLKLTRELFKVTGDVKYADFYERAFINEIMSSQNPESGMTTYFKPMGTGYFKVFGNPTNNFWCCTGTGMENFTKLNDSIYYHTDNDLYVNMYLSSTLDWKEKGLKLTGQAQLPDSDEVTFNINAAPLDAVNIKFRSPYWLAKDQDVTLSINDEKISVSEVNGYIDVNRVWKAGDVVKLTLPMEVQVSRLPDNDNAVAFTYGPVVLSAGLGTKNMATASHGVSVTIATIPSDVTIKDYIIIRTGSVDDWINNIKNNLVKTDGKVEFTLRNTDEDYNLKFTPHYVRYTDRYGIYYELADATSDQFQQYILNNKNASKMQDAIIDEVQLTNDQHELAHNMQGNPDKGSLEGYNYREASSALDQAGWFSYDMAVNPSVANYVGVKYHSGDAGNIFNIYVDGQLLKEETLQAQGTTGFYDVRYKIPDQWTSGKTKVTIKFANRGSSTAGPIYESLYVIKDYDTNADLKSVTVDGNELSASNGNYFVTVPKDATQAVLKLTPANKNALVYLNDILIDDTTNRTVALEAGINTFKVRVVAEDGITEKYYAVSISNLEESEVVPVSGVTLDKNTASVEQHRSVQLTATIAPANASNVAVMWSSSDSTIANVTQSGKVTGVKTGTAIITATTVDGSFKAQCTVTVIPTTGGGNVAWYKFDEADGATVVDSSDSANNATIIGATGNRAEGRFGNALQLRSASNQYVQLPQGIVADLSDFTVATWINPSTMDTWARIFDFGRNTNNNMFLTLRASSNNQPRFAIRVNGSSEQQLNAGSNFKLSQNTWYHIAITKSGNTAKMYLNGVLAATNNNMTFKPSDMGVTNNNWIGRSQYSDPYLNGMVDEFSIYDFAMSADGIKALTIIDIPVVNVTTDAGVAPVLPDTVTVNYQDGTSGTEPVTWAEIDPASYASEGSFTVTGVISGAVLTAIADVEVTPSIEPSIPVTVISADSSVNPGATFTVGIGLDKLDKSVYAEDITLSFDSNVFEYISASGVDENIQIVREGKPTDGKVRFIVANIGGISGDSTEVMNVTFKVKAGVLSTTGIIAITDAKLGVAPEGTVIEADLDSKSIAIEDAQPVIDKTALIAAIDSAQSLYDAAEVGTEPGQYPQKAKDTFGAAIDVAKAVRDNSSATQSQVDNAVTALNSAVDTFKEAVIKEVSADINNDGIIDVADLAFVAYYYGKDSTFVDWEVAKIADMNGDNKIDILDLAYVALKILD